MEQPTSNQIKKKGWPWTADVPKSMYSPKEDWPKISIVTPSYNQGEFIEETILSVLQQNYPNLEYIIIDGGSTDATVEVIKNYETHLSYWVSEPDKGQANAINKGFQRSSGEILYWINSDDILMPNALYIAAKLFRAFPNTDMIYGDRYIIDAKSKKLGERKYIRFDPRQFSFQSGVAQETAFWRRSISEQIGWLDESFDFTMDREYWCRISRNGIIRHVPVFLGCYRKHAATKTNNIQDIQKKEAERIREKYFLSWNEKKIKRVKAVLKWQKRFHNFLGWDKKEKKNLKEILKTGL